MQFRTDKEVTIQNLISPSSKSNTITQAYAKWLGFQVWKTDAEAQKIIDLLLKVFWMVIASF